MNRRLFLKSIGVSLFVNALPIQNWIRASELTPVPSNQFSEVIPEYLANKHEVLPKDKDINVSAADHPLLQSSFSRFKRIQAIVGYANFSLLGFDDSLKVANDYSKVGPFSTNELLFLEKIFYTEATRYGFMGEKTFPNLTDNLTKADIIKIPKTGNYLYKGVPLKLYERLSRDIGEQMLLTAGIRGLAKQYYLFLRKVISTKGNLSLASQSIAPPGYSFHGVGDFDVGQTGYGAANFTIRFSHTDVYRKMRKLDYIVFRYPRNNGMGVQFEPWHIQVA